MRRQMRLLKRCDNGGELGACITHAARIIAGTDDKELKSRRIVGLKDYHIHKEIKGENQIKASPHIPFVNYSIFSKSFSASIYCFVY